VPEDFRIENPLGTGQFYEVGAAAKNSQDERNFNPA